MSIFLKLDFEKSQFTAKYFYEQLKRKGIIVRSTKKGYQIKNKLRLIIGSKKENFASMNAVKRILN